MTTDLATAQGRLEAAQVALFNTAPQCTFYARIPTGAEPPTYRYEALYVAGNGYGQGVALVTPYPPAVGDLVYLSAADRHGTYRVIERSWQHSNYGSANWRAGTKWATVGPLLTIIVEQDAGPFRDEADGSETGED